MQQAAVAPRADGAPDVVRVHDLEFAWPGQPPVLLIPEFRLGAGEHVFLAGRSGSGKSTLLGLLGGVLRPGGGRVEVLGTDLGALGAARRDAFRADHVGFLFQLFNLVPYLSVLDNVILPCRFSRLRRERTGPSPATEARRLLARLGLEGEALLRRRVTELSIGQQQRVAAARALIGRPELVIADEPTSALDSDSRDSFLDLLGSECSAAGSAILFVSHDRALAGHFHRTVELAELNRADAPGNGPHG
jgi:putative ABC transport system ATP-binding protein